MVTSSSLASPQLMLQFREQVKESLLFELGTLLTKIHTSSSGALAETMVQLLPKERFRALVALVLQHTTDDISSDFSVNLAIRIAQKLGLNVTNELISTGSANILTLIHCEYLRRKGHLEYSWPTDIFTKSAQTLAADEGYAKLTDQGQHEAYQAILEMMGDTKYKM